MLYHDSSLNIFVTGNQLDLVFLLHFSNKIQRNSFSQVLDFLKSSVFRADIDSGAVRVGAAVYRGNAEVVFNLNQYASKQDVMTGIDRINFNYRDGQVGYWIISANVSVMLFFIYSYNAIWVPRIPCLTWD